MLLGAVLIYYKPDTRCVSAPPTLCYISADTVLRRALSIEGWARKEAEKKLAEKGETVRFLAPAFFCPSLLCCEPCADIA